jgi:hypothetical protein
MGTTIGGTLPALDPNQRFALLVGVGHYPKPEYDLPGPAGDVRATRDLLINRFGFAPANIVVLPDAAATRDSIIWGFRQHLAKAGPGGLAVFYFVGHGLRLDKNYSVQDPEPENKDQAFRVVARAHWIHHSR